MEIHELLENLEALLTRPGKFDFFQAVRIIENLKRELPPLGTSFSPKKDSVRFGQLAHMNFSSTDIANAKFNNSKDRLELDINCLGLLGINGPMPSFLTEHIQHMIYKKNKTMLQFLNMFNHRFISLFYRAWFVNNIVASSEKTDFDQFKHYFYSLVGENFAPKIENSSLPVNLKLFFSGHLSQSEKNKESLLAVIKGFFGIPVKIEECVESWLEVPEGSKFELGKPDSDCSLLGFGTFLGSKVWNKTAKFKIILGPLSIEEYNRMLPGTNAFTQLKETVDHFSPVELKYDIQYILKPEAISTSESIGLLGYSFWMFTDCPAMELNNLVVESL